jgi:hypothetical protein
MRALRENSVQFSGKAASKKARSSKLICSLLQACASLATKAGAKHLLKQNQPWMD